MATPAPAVQPGDVWGQQLLDHINSKHTDTLNAAKGYADAKVQTLVLGPQDPVPAGTPGGTVIYRSA